MVLFSRSFVRKRMISLATTASVAGDIVRPSGSEECRSRTWSNADPICRGPIGSTLEEQLFRLQNAAAMKKMMADMTIKPNW